MPLAGRLTERKQVPFAVEEECATLTRAFARVVVGHRDDLVGHLKVAHAEALKLEAAGPQVRHSLIDVLDLEAELGGAARRGARGREDVELRRPADVAQPTFALFDRLEAESVAIEASRAVKVPRRKLGDGVRVGEWGCND